MKKIVIIILPILIVGLTAYLFFLKGKKDSSNSGVLFEKIEVWSPCQEGQVCKQNIKVLNSGDVILEGKDNYKTKLTTKDIDKIKSIIKETNLMDRKCPFNPVLDYTCIYKLHFNDKFRKISFPACQDQLKDIDSIVNKVIKK